MNLPKKRKIVRPQAEHIAYLQGDGNYTQVFLLTGYKLIFAYTLSRMVAECWPDFIRVHKSFAVNPAAVKEISLEGDQQQLLIELSTAAESTKDLVAVRVLIPVARRQSRKVVELIQALNK